MSRLTQARRWSAGKKRSKAPAMTEHSITPEEAREALLAIVLQLGHSIERVYDYDPRGDKFRVVCRNADGKLIDCTVYGETVAKVVFAARAMTGNVRLVRPSELARAVR